MAEHIDGDDGWELNEITCYRCGWKGILGQCNIENNETFADCFCPECDASIALVGAPSQKDSNSDKAQPSMAEILRDQWLASSLKSIDQLPDLTESKLELIWDMERYNDSDFPYTIIRNDDDEIWREMAVFEGYERFRVIAHILKQKYGDRLVDLVPTSASETYLIGDRYEGYEIVTEIRSSLKEKT